MKHKITIVLFAIAFFAGIVGVAHAEEILRPLAKPTSDQITCKAYSGDTIKMPTTYLYFEHNSTAGDTGIHGMFDSSTFAELCIYDPSGNQILSIKPQNQLGKLTMAGIFFESREPPHQNVSVEEHLRNFPEGKYAVRGMTYDGIGYTGAATLTHNIPNPPKMIFPKEMAEESNIKSQIITPRNVTVKWKPVTETIFGKPVVIKAYEVIVRSLLPSDPHGFSHDNLDIHLPSSATSLSIPNEFWKQNTQYEFEVLAIEESGNQTLVSGFFQTTSIAETKGLFGKLFGREDDSDNEREWFGTDDTENAKNEDSDITMIVIFVGAAGLLIGILLQKLIISKRRSTHKNK